MSMTQKYRDHSWIKIKRWRDDSKASWEERFKALEKHHTKETEFLINEVLTLVKAYDELEEMLAAEVKRNRLPKSS